ncbi:hypothetical protein NA78x_000041 [Anatilimnocola sp. NA78]|uniref:hypothetical protein n=1 Tax=Anatilimnocola sp. NA78 TaxID=3415683 RepID=UPI003CE46A29
MPALYSTFRALSLAAMIATGISALWFLALVTADGTLPLRPGTTGSEQLQVLADGTPVIEKHTQNYSKTQVLTIDLEPTSVSPHHLLAPQLVFAPHDELIAPAVGWGWYSRLASINDGASPANYWYLVHDGQPNGLAYGVGYNTLTKEVIGYFGRAGFTEKMPGRDTWFEIAGTTSLIFAVLDRNPFVPYSQNISAFYVHGNNQVWEIDTRRRRVTSLFESPGIVSLGWAWRTSDKLPEEGDGLTMSANAIAPRSLAILLPKEIVLIDPKTRQREEFALPEELKSAAMSLTRLADGRLLVISRDRSTPGVQTLTWLKPGGEITEQRRVVANSVVGPSARTGMVMFAIGAPAIAWQIPLYLKVAWSNLHTRKAVPLSSATTQVISASWPGFLLTVVVSAGLAIAAYRRHRRFGLPGATWWAAFVFLFGPAGWFAYRWHRTWPPLEDCPACEQPAPRDRVRCLECGTSFPPPELKGIEIFA